MDTPDGSVTGLLQAAQLGSQETAVRKPAQARMAHLPPGKGVGWARGGGPGAVLPPIPYPGGNRPEG